MSKPSTIYLVTDFRWQDNSLCYGAFTSFEDAKKACCSVPSPDDYTGRQIHMIALDKFYLGDRGLSDGPHELFDHTEEDSAFGL